MAGTFTADMGKFAKKFKLTLDEAHRGIVIKLFSSVVLDTPVDKGQLRGNWNVSTGSPDLSTSAKLDPSGGSVLSAINANPGKAGEESFLANSLPYAGVAEYGQWGTGNADEDDSKVTPQGFSKKAPAGMVRKNVARIQLIVKQSVARAKGKVR